MNWRRDQTWSELGSEIDSIKIKNMPTGYRQNGGLKSPQSHLSKYSFSKFGWLVGSFILSLNLQFNSYLNLYQAIKPIVLHRRCYSSNHPLPKIKERMLGAFTFWISSEVMQYSPTNFNLKNLTDPSCFSGNSENYDLLKIFQNLFQLKFSGLFITV